MQMQAQALPALLLKDKVVDFNRRKGLRQVREGVTVFNS
jgi:hypothetical protein